MTVRRIDLAAIRRLKLAPQKHPPRISDPQEKTQPLLLSRCGLLGLTALAGIVVPPAMSLAQSRMGRAVESILLKERSS
jgi:hypothetical protein